jgi:hypothetical protein
VKVTKSPKMAVDEINVVIRLRRKGIAFDTGEAVFCLFSAELEKR